MNPLITTDEVRGGKLLVKTDDAEYRQVAVVYKLNGEDRASFYCSVTDWPQTDVGRTAALYAEIERLRAELDQYRKPAVEKVETHAASVYPYCPECGDGPFNTRKGWKAHRRIKHGER